MRTTNFYLDYELQDVSVLADGTVTTSSNQSFADISLIKTDSPFPNYGTMEHNFFVLDGTLTEFPDTPSGIPFFSSSKSNSNGTFTSNPKFSVNFTKNHASIGLTLKFVDDNPLQVKITWYTLLGSKLSEQTLDIASTTFIVNNPLLNYGRVEFEFLKTIPYHYIKMYYVNFGMVVRWDENNIKNGKIIEEVDCSGDKISINKMNFELIDLTGDLNLGNINGLHRYFQKGQKMRPHEVVNGIDKPLGIYFLDSFSEDSNLGKMSCIDYIGLMDNTLFIDGQIYSGVTAGTIIDKIFDSCGISDYIVDTETASTLVYGTIKIMTCRKALREVLLACGSCVDDSRSDYVNIYKADKTIGNKIGLDRKISTKVTKDDYISDVTINFSDYVLNDNVVEIYKGTYASGIHTITFTTPCSALTINSGTILTQSTYYCIIDLSAQTDVVISGKKYTSTTSSYTSSITNIESGEVRKTKSISGTLFNNVTAKIIADRLLDYYSMRLIIAIQYIAADENIRQWNEIVNVDSSHTNYMAGFNSISTDLTGGFISTAKLRGYYQSTTDYYYCDDELYMEGNGII